MIIGRVTQPDRGNRLQRVLGALRPWTDRGVDVWARGKACEIRYYEPALKLTRADGNRDVVLRYLSHTMHGNTLDITLKDIRDDIQVLLHYRVYPDYGILSAAPLSSTAPPSRSCWRARNRRPGTCPPAKAIGSRISPAAGPPRRK